jgi:hypothetical protein
VRLVGNLKRNLLRCTVCKETYLVRSRVRLTTFPPSYAVVMKSGNLNFLEPSGLLQACDGTALPYMLMFLWPTLNSLQMFSYGTMSSPARAMSIFSFIPDICKHGGFNCDGHRRYVNSILYVPPEELKWCEVTGRRRPNDRVACANPFARKFSIEKSRPTCNVQMLRHCAFLLQWYVMRTLLPKSA